MKKYTILNNKTLEVSEDKTEKTQHNIKELQDRKVNLQKEMDEVELLLSKFN